MKKRFLIIPIIIIIAIIVILIGKNINSKKYDYKIEEVSEYNYYIYRENEQFGIIDKDGKIIIEAKYSNIILPNPQKDVFICYNGNEPEVLNSKNEKMFTEYKEVEPIKLKSVANTLSYEKDTLIYRIDKNHNKI